MANDDHDKRPVPKPEVRELPPPSSQAWAIVAPQLVVRRPKAD
jgi:hypothetical protein